MNIEQIFNDEWLKKTLEVSFELQFECTILHVETWKAVETFSVFEYVNETI